MRGLERVDGAFKIFVTKTEKLMISVGCMCESLMKEGMLGMSDAERNS